MSRNWPYWLAVALAVALLLAFIFGAGHAFAQALIPDGRVTMQPIVDAVMPYLVQLAIVLITAAVLWLTALVRKWTGIQIEAKDREALQSALSNGARLVLDRLGDRAGSLSVNVQHPALEVGVEYVLRSVPDATRRFGIGPERIRELLLPKLLPPAEAVVGPLGHVERSGR